MPNRRSLLVALLALSGVTQVMPASHADQAAFVTREQADAAVAALKEAGTVRHYCAPCEDTGWRAETVGTAEAMQVEGEPHYEVLVNGAGTDLAYAYVESEGTWTNLAVDLKIPVENVPDTLPEGLTELPAEPMEELGDIDVPGPGFEKTLFVGDLEGGSQMVLELWKSTNDLGGRVYEIGHGIAYDVFGTLDEAGKFTLQEVTYDESAKDQAVTSVTGTLGGDLQVQVALKVKGQEPRQATLRPLAIDVARDASFTGGSIMVQTRTELPFFLGEGGQYQALNRMLYMTLEKHADSILSAALEESLKGGHDIAITPSDRLTTRTFVSYRLTGWSNNLASLVHTMYEQDGEAPRALTLLIEGESERLLKLGDFLAGDAGAAALLEAANKHLPSGTSSLAEVRPESVAISRQGLVVAVDSLEDGHDPLLTVPYAELETHLSPLLKTWIAQQAEP
jgi:hypothetical protein